MTETTPVAPAAPVAPLDATIFSVTPGSRMILTGAAAAARGAHEAGIGLVVTYPGSPITETFDQLASPDNPSRPVCHTVINEHVAFHKAMGFALTGGRTLVTMKHVGFNVAADPAHYIGYTGVRGGMVILVGTDPGATCSTGEYDFRFYALHTQLPLLEPSSGQEILDLVRRAFAWSEEDRLPYVIAVPAGACYGIEAVTVGEVLEPRRGEAFVNSPDLTNVGRRAVKRHQDLLDRAAEVAKRGAHRHLVSSFPASSSTLIITSGIHLSRVREALRLLNAEDRAGVVGIAQTWPCPVEALRPLLAGIERIVFVEDLGGFLEISLSRFLLSLGRPLEIHGKDLFPGCGAIDLYLVKDRLAQVLGVAGPAPRPDFPLPEREGTFCPGCPDRAFFHTLTEFLGPEDVLGGDIGCSSLPPHFSSWLTCMNSGTAISAGVTLALNGRHKVVSLIGDSTLLHSGLQTVIEAAATDSDQVCFVLDNHWTAMTGHQRTPATPVDDLGKPCTHIDLETMLRACGVKQLVRADPFYLDAFRATVRKVLDQNGFRVILVERECGLQERRRPVPPGWRSRFVIEPERCHECMDCYERFCCPAIVKGDGGKPEIDPILCTRCGVCAQVCRNGAIVELRYRQGDED